MITRFVLSPFALARAALFLVALPPLTGHAATQGTPAPLDPGVGQGLFLIVTDIHFDPFAQPELVPALDKSPVSEWSAIFKNGAGDNFQGYGKDAGYPLMVSALQAAATQSMTYDYVLYTGDYLSHGFERDYDRHTGPNPEGLTSFSIKTARYVSRLLSETFGDIPILGVMGNTDAVCGDYKIALESPFTLGVADQWANLSKQPERFEQFGTGGFYKVAHPTVADQDIIVLNNIFWTPRYSDSCGTNGGDPGSAMMSWLDWQLYQSQQANRKAQILLHVPPGINAYNTARGSGACNQRISPFWGESYAEGFLDLMRKYAGVVDYTFSGHTHMDSFVIIPDADGVPLIASQITPAVSPIFGNNPAFAVFLYDRNQGNLLDSATFYLANLQATENSATPDWQLEYTYRQTYSTRDLSAKSRSAVASRIKTDTTLRGRFSELYAVKTQGSGPIRPLNWQAFACAQSAVVLDTYEACYCDGV